MRSIWIKLTNWEYWPAYIANIPVVFFWLWFAMRARKLFFFTAINPAIETGGMLGASKSGILRLFPGELVPTSLLLTNAEKQEKTVREWMATHKVSFPIILKPDIGERGFLVKKANDLQDVEEYLRRADCDVIAQAYVDLPMEVSIFYSRLPGNEAGEISSLCLKEYLHVEGDGQQTVDELMRKKNRAFLQRKRLQRMNPNGLKYVPEEGEVVLLEPIGNHSRGTKFINGNQLIDGRLVERFDRLFSFVEGVNYGRFDLKCNSLEDIKRGGPMKIFEFNGVASEPAHVYDPDYSVWKAYRDFYRHWRKLFDIYKIQSDRGVPVIPFWEAVFRVPDHFLYLNRVRKAYLARS